MKHNPSFEEETSRSAHRYGDVMFDSREDDWERGLSSSRNLQNRRDEKNVLKVSHYS